VRVTRKQGFFKELLVINVIFGKVYGTARLGFCMICYVQAKLFEALKVKFFSKHRAVFEILHLSYALVRENAKYAVS
jgi:hypothetical protein